MGTVNLTRENLHNQKKTVKVMSAFVDFTDADGSSQIATSADVYELGILPTGDVLITGARIVTVTASDAATSAACDIGFAGGAELLDDADMKAAGETAMSGSVLRTTGGTITITPTYTGATSAGRHLVLVEYVELEQRSGELTNYSAT